MQEMVIYGVSFDLGSKQPTVLLKTPAGNPFLPIRIGHPHPAATPSGAKARAAADARKADAQ